ncbi:hypothetical protein, partial [uncultured Agitococcus sp.]|uniref:hypothetical protein n=1 Tax=uncultured Agitococcus sp. TaxID=1506599 RepID=UPI00261887C8
CSVKKSKETCIVLPPNLTPASTATSTQPLTMQIKISLWVLARYAPSYASFLNAQSAFLSCILVPIFSGKNCINGCTITLCTKDFNHFFMLLSSITHNSAIKQERTPADCYVN